MDSEDIGPQQSHKPGSTISRPYVDFLAPGLKYSLLQTEAPARVAERHDGSTLRHTGSRQGSNRYLPWTQILSPVLDD